MNKDNLIQFLKEMSLVSNRTYIKSSIYYHRAVRCSENKTTVKLKVKLMDLLADKESHKLMKYISFLKLYNIIDDDDLNRGLCLHFTST